MDLGEIAWVAGLVEGEGCLGYYGSKARPNRSPMIKVAMTDGDIVQRFADIVGANRIGPYSRKAPQKPIYSCAVNGDRAIWWMHLIYWFMGERRRARIVETLLDWQSRPGRGGHNYYGPKLKRNRPLGSGAGRKCPRRAV